MLNKYAIFSNHAKDRLKECQLTLAKANWLLYYGEKEKLPKEMKEDKDKYHESAIYIRSGVYIFTLIEVVDKYSGDDVYLVISVYDQRIGL